MSGGPTPVEIPFVRLPEGRDLPPPERGTAAASGFDLRARLEAPLVLGPGERALVGTGIRLALPAGFEAQVRARSGLAFKHGLTVLNGPGTVDSDFRGEVSVLLINLGREPVTVARGDRIAQLVVQRLPEVRLTEVDALTETARGAGGFGHTGER